MIDDIKYGYRNYYDKIDNDLLEAIHYNIEPFDYSRIETVVLTLVGENDESDWAWLVKLTGGKFAYVRGGCDYTGWECQSNLDWHEADSLEEAIALAEEEVRQEFQSMMDEGVSTRDSKLGW